jgi:sulfate transport system ATP-binding protein
VSIEVRNITKSFGSFTALRNVSLTVPTGELAALLGPSGCGKTTLLRIVAGLEEADDGSVHFFGVDTKDLRVRERRVGYVFQHYALFRHMTVFENVAFGLRACPRRTRPSENAIRAKVRELLDLVQLEFLADRYPPQLSGGQRQRIALARALAVEPRVLLLDEPFGALDARVRKELRRWLRRLHDELHITSVFVTHDQEEALEVADRVAVMNEGMVEQEGAPEEVYHHPVNPFVYKFLGNVNLFRGRIEEGRIFVGDLPGERIEMPVEILDHIQRDVKSAVVCVRRHMLEIETEDPGCGRAFRAKVRHINPAGPHVNVELVAGWGETMDVEVSQERCGALHLARGQEVYVTAREKKIFIGNEFILNSGSRE